MKSKSRAVTIVVTGFIFAAAGPAFAAQVDATWNVGSGNWNVAANWLPAVVPSNGAGGNTYRVFIDNGNATNSVVTLTTNPTIDQLTISAGDQLSSSNGTDLRIMVGPIVNDGLISWVSTGSATEFELATSMSLTGSGVLFFGNSNENFIDNIDTAVIPHLTHGASHTIRGGGSIVDVTMTNDGLINANQPTQMTIDLESGTNTNNGTLQASGTGTLLLTGTVWTNTTGMIQALDTSTVNIVSSTILGGTLHAAPGAVISPTSNSLLKDFTLTGLLRQDNSEDAIYEGVITNNGTIAAISTGSATEIQLNVNGATFNGTGEVVLGNHSQNFFDDDDGTGTPMLVNGATHTIRGAGAFFDIGLTNNGLIHADQTTQMTIDLEGTASTNTGTIQASGTSTLLITGTTITNTNGLIQALDTSTVNIVNSSILGGTLHAAVGAVISPTSNTLIQDVTLTGLMRQDNNEDALYEGVITNNGTIAALSTGGSTQIQIRQNGATFNGTGEILLGNSTQNIIDDDDGAGDPLLINGVGHTIRGAGGIVQVVLNNAGTIIADGTVSFSIDPPTTIGFVNSGSVQVTGAGGMSILSGPFTTSGTVNISAGRTLTRAGAYTQTAGTTTVNGTLISTGATVIEGGTIRGNGTVSGPQLINSGTISPGDGIGPLSIQNIVSLAASSVIDVEIGGLTPVTQHDQLAVTGAAHLDGVLKVTFVSGFDPQIGDSFIVMTYLTTPLNSLGNFKNLDVPCNLLGRKLQVEITTTQVTVRIVSGTSMFVDINCDCGYSMQIDVPAFITALLDPASFTAQFPTCPLLTADLNGDSAVNGRDVQSFINALLN